MTRGCLRVAVVAAAVAATALSGDGSSSVMAADPINCLVGMAVTKAPTCGTGPTDPVCTPEVSTMHPVTCTARSDNAADAVICMLKRSTAAIKDNSDNDTEATDTIQTGSCVLKTACVDETDVTTCYTDAETMTVPTPALRPTPEATTDTDRQCYSGEQSLIVGGSAKSTFIEQKCADTMTGGTICELTHVATAGEIRKVTVSGKCVAAADCVATTQTGAGEEVSMRECYQTLADAPEWGVTLKENTDDGGDTNDDNDQSLACWIGEQTYKDDGTTVAKSTMRETIVETVPSEMGADGKPLVFTCTTYVLHDETGEKMVSITASKTEVQHCVEVKTKQATVVCYNGIAKYEGIKITPGEVEALTTPSRQCWVGESLYTSNTDTETLTNSFAKKPLTGTADICKFTVSPAGDSTIGTIVPVADCSEATLGVLGRTHCYYDVSQYSKVDIAGIETEPYTKQLGIKDNSAGSRSSSASMTLTMLAAAASTLLTAAASVALW